MSISLNTTDLLHLTAASWIDNSSRRHLSACKWHRKPNKCNKVAGCTHDGIRCIGTTSPAPRIASLNCSLFHRKRRKCMRNGCHFDIPTRQCFLVTQAPTPKPSALLLETASPSTQPSALSTAPSSSPSTLPSSSTPSPSTQPSALSTAPSISPSTLPSSSTPSMSPTVSTSTTSESGAPSSLLVTEQSFQPTTADTSHVASAKPSFDNPTFIPSMSPSTFTMQSIAGPTQSPTQPLQSQTFCSRYHHKPRRCVNRGCLFDNSSLQCTNGKPTSTPSASPSITPTQSSQPTKIHYHVRMYWEQGYDWQDNSAEQWFCWSCAECKACTKEVQDRTGDCVDLLCDIKSYCSEGMAIAVSDCSPYQWSDKSASFSVLTDNHGLFDTSLKGDQIQVHDTNLCLSQSGDRAISLQNCNSSKIEQRFVGFTSGGEGAMELTPANVNANDKCLTQHHHPRLGERIFVEDCKKARRSDTNLWDLWLAY